MKKIIFTALVLFVVSCTNNKMQETDAQQERSIHVYSYEGFSTQDASYLVGELKKVYPSVVAEGEVLRLPSECYLKAMNRYRAQGLLDDLKLHQNGGAVLGLTDRVIFHPNEISPTYGIYGLSYTGGYVSVLSSTKPSSGKKHNRDHMKKLMLHELGHAFGLSHCKNQHCIMVDAEHRNKFSQTPSFCDNCKETLNKKEWNIR